MCKSERKKGTRTERGLEREAKQNIGSIVGVSVARLHFPAGFTPKLPGQTY